MPRASRVFRTTPINADRTTSFYRRLSAFIGGQYFRYSPCAKLIPTLGGYFGRDAAARYSCFGKGAWIAGSVGLRAVFITGEIFHVDGGAHAGKW